MKAGEDQEVIHHENRHVVEAAKTDGVRVVGAKGGFGGSEESGGTGPGHGGGRFGERGCDGGELVVAKMVVRVGSVLWESQEGKKR
jgi:hypothetical protein